MDTITLAARHLLLEDMDPNEVFVNNDIYNNTDIETRYAQAKDKWRWTKGWIHAMGEMFFIMGIVIIFVLLYLQDRRIDRARLRTAIANADKYTTADGGVAVPPRSFLDRISTHFRSFTYKRTRGRWWWTGLGKMSLGLALIVIAGWAYPLLYVFTQRPYYREFARFGPPGLASRAGMIAVSTTPFIIALGMKANLISYVTGVGHERLNAFHRQLAMLAGFMAVVHTVPFLVEPVREKGWGELKRMLFEGLLGKGNIYYWNGLAALICLAWLNIASLGFVRRWCYEFFAHLHIFFGVGYLAMLFWHCNNMLSSWHYLWATALMWGGGLAYRMVFKTNWFSSSGKWFDGDMATFTRLTDDGVKITILTTMKWEPGQHIFIRIPGISWFDNHPFTIASIMDDDLHLPSPESTTTMDTLAKLKGEYVSPAAAAMQNESRLARVRISNKFGDSGEEKNKVNEMVVVFKPYQGFTRKAFDISRKHTDISYRCLLDGPYGGMPRALESFDTVLMVAGGSGITPVVAHLKDLCKKIRAGKAVTCDVRIVWTVKRFECLEWFKDEISIAARSVPFGVVHCQYFVTEESPVEFCDYPVSATREWPTTPAIPDWPEDPTSLWGGGNQGPHPDFKYNPPQPQPPVPAIPEHHSPKKGVESAAFPPPPGTAISTDEPNRFPSPYPQYPPNVYSADTSTPNSAAFPIPALPKLPPSLNTSVPPAPLDPFTTPTASSPTHILDPTKITDSHPNPFTTPVNNPAEPHRPAALDLKDTTTISTDFAPISLSAPTSPNAKSRPNSKKPALRVSLPAQIQERSSSDPDGIERFPPPSAVGRQSYGPGDFGDEVMIEFGRPRLREGIRPWAESFGARTCVYVCGPETMKVDVSNAVAKLQHDVWRKGTGREEVYLHTETFGW